VVFLRAYCSKRCFQRREDSGQIYNLEFIKNY